MAMPGLVFVNFDEAVVWLRERFDLGEAEGKVRDSSGMRMVSGDSDPGLAFFLAD